MDRLDSESATFVSLWVGVASFVIGVASTIFAVYTYFKDKPDIFLLTLSGWLAALLCGVVAWLVGSKLVRVVSEQGKEITRLQ